MSRNTVIPRSIMYLLAVAEQKSFTRAAEVLYVSQPTLSQQIKQLEDSLNVQLLDRSGRTIQLTSAGEVYLQHARRALGELESAARAIHDLQDLSRGTLRLAMTPITDYLTLPLLAQFVEHYPGISVSTLEMPQNDMRDALVENRVDLGIAFSNTLTEMCSNMAHCHTLLVEKLVLVFGEDHHLAKKKGPLGKHGLEQEPLVLLNQDYAIRTHIDQYYAEQNITPYIKMETSSLNVIIEMVRRCEVSTILPTTIAEQQHGLKTISLLPEMPRHTISLVCNAELTTRPACRAFQNMASEFFGTELPTETAR